MRGYAWWVFTRGGSFHRGPFRSWTAARRASHAIVAAGNRVTLIVRDERWTPLTSLEWVPGAIDEGCR